MKKKLELLTTITVEVQKRAVRDSHVQLFFMFGNLLRSVETRRDFVLVCK